MLDLRISVAAFAMACSGPVCAQTVLSGDHSIAGRACIGSNCGTPETFNANDQLKLQGNTVSILFEDQSDDGSFPGNDWRLLVNDGFANASGGKERFSVQDVDGGTIPFTIEAGAPNQALWLDTQGDLGLGTMFPAANLHIVDGNPSMRIEQDSSLGYDPAEWIFRLGASGEYTVVEGVSGKVPFQMSKSGFVDQAVMIGPYAITLDPGQYGEVVVSDTPGFSALARLHMRFNDGTAQALIEETSAIISPRTLLNLQNNGRPEIVMGNSSTNGEWSFGAGSNFVLKQGTVGSDSSVKTKLFEVSPAGDAILAGSLVTGGTTCGGGCDAVFSDDYDLPSIEDHAHAMFALGHLPNVGPTVENAPINVTDKLGRVLNELEHAHIFIAQQQGALAAQGAEIAALRQDLAALRQELAAKD